MIDFEALRPEKGRPVPEETPDAFVYDPLFDVLPWEDVSDVGSRYPL